MDAGDDDNDGSGLRLARAAVAQGSVYGVRAADVDDGSGYGGDKGDSGLRLARALKRLGRGGNDVNEKPTPPLFL